MLRSASHYTVPQTTVLCANTYSDITKSHIYYEPHQETASKHSAEVLQNQTPQAVNKCFYSMAIYGSSKGGKWKTEAVLHQAAPLPMVELILSNR